MKSLLPLVVALSLLSVGCRDDDNTDTDAGLNPGDAGTDAGVAEVKINGCGDADFVKAEFIDSNRTIDFGGTNGSGSFTFFPACLEVAENQVVTFSGAFGSHPLRPGVAAEATGTASPNSPITAQNAGNSTDFTFPTVGVYPFFCNNHHGIGMYGAVRVIHIN